MNYLRGAFGRTTETAESPDDSSDDDVLHFNKQRVRHQGTFRECQSVLIAERMAISAAVKSNALCTSLFFCSANCFPELSSPGRRE